MKIRGIVKYNLFPIFTHSRLRGVVGVIYIVPNIYIFGIAGLGMDRPGNMSPIFTYAPHKGLVGAILYRPC